MPEVRRDGRGTDDVPASGPFAGKVALVTGASSGIGAETALELARQGAAVACVGRSVQWLSGTVSGVERLGRPALAVVADLRHRTEVQECTDQILSRFGRIDVAVNNAGAVALTPFLEISAEEWDLIVGTNLTAVFYCMQQEIAAMLLAGGGSIVNIGSVGGHRAATERAPYIASKHGLNGLTKAAALEFADKGIRINCISPGRVETAMFASAVPDPAERARKARAVPIGRFAEPGELARAIAWVASDAASYLVGAIIPVDGGIVLGHV